MVGRRMVGGKIWRWNEQDMVYVGLGFYYVQLDGVKFEYYLVKL